MAKHLQAAAASLQRLLAVTPQQLGAGQEGQLAQSRLQLQSTQPLGTAAAASAQPGSPEAGPSQGPQMAPPAAAAQGPQDGVAADSAATAAEDLSQGKQAAGTLQPPGLLAAAAPPRQPTGAARQLPEFSSSAPSRALSCVLAGPSLQAPGQGGGHLAVKEQAAAPAAQIQDVNQNILELLKRVRPLPVRPARLTGAHMCCYWFATGPAAATLVRLPLLLSSCLKSLGSNSGQQVMQSACCSTSPPESAPPCLIQTGCCLRHGSSHLFLCLQPVRLMAHISSMQVGANEVVQQIFGFVSDAFAQHQSKSLVAERNLLAAMAVTQQQGAAQQEQLLAAVGALSSMHHTVQAVLSRPLQQTVSVIQVKTRLCKAGCSSTERRRVQQQPPEESPALHSQSGWAPH